MNEETILQGQTMANGKENPNNEQSNSPTWKQVSIGGMAGILMGGGAMYATDSFAASKEGVPAEGATTAEVIDTQEGAAAQEVVDTHEGAATNGVAATQEIAQSESIKVAEVSDNMSFKDAFNAARDQVGAGGVFRWHGGIYNTYTAEEWNSMSDAEKSDFAELVKPEISVVEIDTAQITEATPDIHIHVHIHEATPVAQPTSNPSGGEDPWEGDDDVRLVARGEYEGHNVYGYDLNRDEQPDVAIIDVDDSGNPSDPDVAVDPEGNMATLGELAGEVPDPTTDPNLQTTFLDNPEVAPDMPDYSNDADIDVIA